MCSCSCIMRDERKCLAPEVLRQILFLLVSFNFLLFYPCSVCCPCITRNPPHQQGASRRRDIILPWEVFAVSPLFRPDDFRSASSLVRRADWCVETLYFRTKMFKFLFNENFIFIDVERTILHKQNTLCTSLIFTRIARMLFEMNSFEISNCNSSFYFLIWKN